MKLVSALLIVILVSSIMFIQVPPVSASVTQDMVYIINLSGVGSWWVDNPSDAVEGAIKALNVTGVNYESQNVPLVHPKKGKEPPFVDMDYEVVTSWNTYKTVIESAENVIVVNTHGEILPVPSGYSKESWADEVAEAMLERQMIWVHIAGYPFYNVWFQGQSVMETWGEGGLQEVMAHIGKSDVTIPILSGSDPDDLTLEAADNLKPLIGGWQGVYNAMVVHRDRPLLESDFSGYEVLRLWGSSTYYTGVVVGFVKPGERFDPELRSGFGAFVHIGTKYTMDGNGEETNADIWRAYVGTAAALWTRMTGFEGTGEDTHTPNGVNLMTHVTPVIIDYDWLDLPGSDDDQWQVLLGFFVMGAMSCPIGYDIGIETVVVHIDASPINGGAQLSLETPLSKQGTGVEEELNAQAMVVVKSALFGLSIIDPTHITTVISGAMLFSDWLTAFATTYNETSPQTIYARYEPVIQTTTIGSYEILEYQTLIITRLLLDKNDENGQPREGWRIMPINYHFELRPQFPITSEYAPKASGSISLATYFEHGDSYNATIFHEDFEDGMEEWDPLDGDPDSGRDYWGILPSNRSYYPHQAWCAGSNWRENLGYYDNDMNAQMELNVDLRPYQEVWLYYRFSAFIKANDYFRVICYGGPYVGQRIYTDCPSGSGRAIINELHVISVPEGTTTILIKFESDSADVDWGVFLKHIELRALIPNDADSLSDAGGGFESALGISVGASAKNYAAYLEREDWFKFYVFSGYTIIASLESKPSSARFFIELRDATSKLEGPGSSINYQVTSSGYYAIRVFSEIGFGQYDFDIHLHFPMGCPFVYVWNGSDFVLDNNLLPGSATSNGAEVEDYYRLEQDLVPFYEGYFNSYYSLRIGEFQQEHSYLDEVDLFAVDHATDVSVAVSPTGEILTYQSPYVPISAVDENNASWLDELSSIDGSYYESYNGSFLVLNFGEVNSSNAKIIIRADPPPDGPPTKTSIHVQVLNSSESWVDVVSIIPRAYWATDIIDLSDYLLSDGEFIVRLYFTDNHRVDFVGLDTTPQAEIDVEDANLLWAYHSSEGAVTAELHSDDDVYAELVPDQQITLLFSAAKPDAEARTFIFYVKGCSYTITD